MIFKFYGLKMIYIIVVFNLLVLISFMVLRNYDGDRKIREEIYGYLGVRKCIYFSLYI